MAEEEVEVEEEVDMVNTDNKKETLIGELSSHRGHLMKNNSLGRLRMSCKRN